MTLRSPGTVENPDLSTALDEAQDRLKTNVIPGQIDLEGKTMTDDLPAVKRTKNPSYMVLAEMLDGDWELLTGEPVSAPTRKAAIVAATEKREEKDGTFLVIPEKDYRPITRARETVDRFE